MKLKPHLFILVFKLFFLYSYMSDAQSGYVEYDHTLTRIKTNRLNYILAGDKATDFRPGPPPKPFYINNGAEACFLVKNPNPFLYSYSINSQVIKEQDSEDISDFLKNLSPLLSILGVETKGTESFDKYNSGLINKITEFQFQLEKARLETDNQPDLAINVKNLTALADSVQLYNDRANELFVALTDTEKKGFLALRAYQTNLEERLKSIKVLISEASSYLLNPLQLCVPVNADRINVSLVVSRIIKPNKDESIGRPIDTVATFQVQPISTKRVRLAPSIIFGVPFTNNGITSYTLEDGKIAAHKDPYFFVPMCLQYRAWKSPFWGTLGIRVQNSIDEKSLKIPDFFLGIAYDFGEDIGGNVPSMSLGIGVTYLNSATRLTNGLKEGDALPSNITDIKDALKYESRLGIGFTFTISKIKFSNK